MDAAAPVIVEKLQGDFCPAVDLYRKKINIYCNVQHAYLFGFLQRDIRERRKAMIVYATISDSGVVWYWMFCHPFVVCIFIRPVTITNCELCHPQGRGVGRAWCAGATVSPCTASWTWSCPRPPHRSRHALPRTHIHCRSYRPVAQCILWEYIENNNLYSIFSHDLGPLCDQWFPFQFSEQLCSNDFGSEVYETAAAQFCECTRMKLCVLIYRPIAQSAVYTDPDYVIVVMTCMIIFEATPRDESYLSDL